VLETRYEKIAEILSFLCFKRRKLEEFGENKVIISSILSSLLLLIS
jgi:hypothetical protein